MADEIFRFRVTLPFVSGLPTDVAINDFTYARNPAGTISDIVDDVIAFYNTENTATGHQKAVAEYISEQVSRATDACRVDVFDIEVPGPPVYSQLFTLGANTGTGELPSEVASCLSFHADYTGADSAERAARRGRVYLGPLDRTSGEVVFGGFRPSQQFANDVVNAANEFLADAADSDGMLWGVWSPSLSQFASIQVVWVDDAYDVLRSRGVAPTHKTELVVT